MDLHDALIHAISRNDLTAVLDAIERGANVNGNDGEPLRLVADFAARKNGTSARIEIVKALLRAGADVNVENDYPLRLACKAGCLEMAICFLEAGSDVHANKDDALLSAAAEGHIEIVKYLVEEGADIHARGDAMMRFAILNGHFEVMNFLYERDIFFDIELAMSAMRQHPKMIAFIDHVKLNEAAKRMNLEQDPESTKERSAGFRRAGI